MAVGAQCRLAQGDAPGARALKPVYDRLVQVHRQYTTLAVQYSKEIGPLVDKLQQGMTNARGLLPPSEK